MSIIFIVQFKDILFNCVLDGLRPFFFGWDRCGRPGEDYYLTVDCYLGEG
jgi:hypothetical protein